MVMGMTENIMAICMHVPLEGLLVSFPSYQIVLHEHHQNQRKLPVPLL